MRLSFVICTSTSDKDLDHARPFPCLHLSSTIQTTGLTKRKQWLVASRKAGGGFKAVEKQAKESQWEAIAAVMLITGAMLQVRQSAPFDCQAWQAHLWRRGVLAAVADEVYEG